MIPRRADAGMVTAEIAMALPALVLVLGFALTVQSAVSTRAGCLDAARAGVREAARGESNVVVDAVVRQALPSAVSVDIAHRRGSVTVSVATHVPMFGRRLALPLVTAASTAADEAQP